MSRATTRAGCGLAAAVIVGAAWPAGVDATPSAPGSVSVTIEALDGGTRIDVAPGGAIVDLAAARRADGRRTLWLLVGPRLDPPSDADGDVCPASVVEPAVRVVEVVPFAADGRATSSARTVRESSAARWIEAVDLDGDGTDALLLGVEDRIEQLSAGGSVGEPLLVDRALADGRPTLIPRSGRPAWLRIAGVGEDRYLRFDPAANGFVPVASIANLTGVGRQSEGLVIWSPAIAPVADAPAETDGPLLASWPRIAGPGRVRVDLVRPAAEDEVARRVECWGRLPGNEQLLEGFVRMLDGAPVAIVTGMPAGSLNLLGEKQLRVIPLRRDRSRRGVSPLLAVETRVNVWQPIEPALHDIDGDGQTDLVLAYWKGLKDDRVVLDVYRRNRAGGFELRPRSTAFDIKRGDRSFVAYGADASGNGRPDLIVAGDGRLQLYEGTDDPSRPIQRPARASIPIGEPCDDEAQGVEIGAGAGGTFVRRTGPGGAPLQVDLDGDGVVELIVRRADCGTPPLSIVRFGATAAPKGRSSRLRLNRPRRPR